MTDTEELEALEEVEVKLVEGPNGRRIYLGKPFPNVYLTTREAELALLLGDFKYREIANIMRISCRTAEYYGLNMQRKLKFSSKREMAEMLHRYGIIRKLKLLIDITYLFSAKISDDGGVVESKADK